MQDAANRFGYANTYSAIELINDVQNELFAEVTNKKPIDSYRRKLQKSYVDKLNKVLNPGTTAGITISFAGLTSGSDISRSDIPSIARNQLTELRKKLIVAVPSTTNKMNKIHLMDLSERIKDAVNPRRS